MGKAIVAVVLKGGLYAVVVGLLISWLWIVVISFKNSLGGVFQEAIKQLRR